MNERNLGGGWNFALMRVFSLYLEARSNKFVLNEKGMIERGWGSKNGGRSTGGRKTKPNEGAGC